MPPPKYATCIDYFEPKSLEKQQMQERLWYALNPEENILITKD